MDTNIVNIKSVSLLWCLYDDVYDVFTVALTISYFLLTLNVSLFSDTFFNVILLKYRTLYVEFSTLSL